MPLFLPGRLLNFLRTFNLCIHLGNDEIKKKKRIPVISVSQKFLKLLLIRLNL